MSDRNSTIFVGSGSSPPKSENILANVGMMKISMNAVAPSATVSTTAGYTIALWILRLRASAFSMYVASRMRISSSTPPASPAATMFRNRSSNTFLCLPSASDSVEPASTSRVVSEMILPNEGLLDCFARMSRHCTSGRPAEIIVANWRVKIARSFVETPGPPNFGSDAPPDFGRSEVTRMRFLRRSSSASSWRPTSISPVWASPASVRPFQMKTAIVVLRSGRRAQDLLELAFQLHAVGAAVQGVFRAELLVEHGLQQGLVHGLHAELLSRLHQAVDLVDLALADHGLDRGRAHEHLGAHDPPRAAAARNELLGDDALQRERELGEDLLLLVGREHVHDAVDGLVRGVRVQRREHEVTGLGDRQRRLDGLEVAHLTNQDDVRV